MALESPLKKEVDKATRDLEALNRKYNIYFQGGEEDPPRQERTQLDNLVTKIKGALATASNSSEKFHANTFISKYQSFCGKWDRTLKGIETGQINRPKKRD
ncbi:MAG: hypothetical protein M9962_04955 [Oligoflexia bacterium]|nr:hypothetical protein [Oligoflexia bacterium]